MTRSPGTSLHRQLFLALRDQIVQGVHGAGATIPAEEELCTRYGVSRITVRRAIANLETRGFVVKRQGRGTFVKVDIPGKRPPATMRFVDALRKTAMETTPHVLVYETAVPPADIAEQLQLMSGSQAVHVLRLRNAGKTTLIVSDTWLPEMIASDVRQEAFEKGTLHDILLAQGIRFGRVIQEVLAISADAAHAGWLGVEVGMPLLRTLRLLHDTDGQAVQYLSTTVVPDRSRLLMEVSASEHAQHWAHAF